ncbi:MAG: metallophosphoesterase [Limisphaerales bacterium]
MKTGVVRRHVVSLMVFATCFGGVSAESASTVIFGITNVWRYNQTANLDGINWKTNNYNDSSWPSGPGLLYYETNALVSPRNTLLNIGRNTYYFRTHFNLTNASANKVLVFSNKIDDGALFYLNGKEFYQRIRVSQPPAIIYYSTGATSEPASGDATEWDVFAVPATNGVVGDNVLAVEVHQIDPSSDDIVFGSALSLADNSVRRGPYLQFGTPTNIVVRWRTDLPTQSTVRYGTNVAQLTQHVDDLTLTNDHELKLPNLTPDTTYFYSVGTPAETMAGGDTNYFFVTAPLPGTSKLTRVWVIGDSGTADAEARSVRDAYFNYTTNRHTDFWLILGDNAYLYGADYEYQAAVFDMYHDLLRQSVIWPTLGNHDTGQHTNFVDTYPYFSIFTLPTNGAAGGVASGTEHFYSFDYANIHVICLDSTTGSRATNGPMANWLRSDLAATTQLWKIAFWHTAPYSKGSHDSDVDTDMIQMRQNFCPILEQGGVDLVLCGHSHVYERSFFLDGHYGLSTTLTSNMILNASSGRETNAVGPYTKWFSGPPAHQGAVYVVDGTSGSTSGGALNHPAMFFSESALGSVVLDIDGDRLNAKFLRQTGVIDDEFTIVKRDIAFSSIQWNKTNVQLTLTNVASKKTNIIQASVTLTNWVSLLTNSVTSNNFRFIDNQATNFTYRFYRAQRLP